MGDAQARRAQCRICHASHRPPPISHVAGEPADNTRQILRAWAVRNSRVTVHALEVLPEREPSHTALRESIAR